MQKSSGRALIFRSIVGHHSISKSNRLFVNLFRSMVGHTFVESHTFALEMTGKGYGRKDN